MHHKDTKSTKRSGRFSGADLGLSASSSLLSGGETAIIALETARWSCYESVMTIIEPINKELR